MTTVLGNTGVPIGEHFANILAEASILADEAARAGAMPPR